MRLDLLLPTTALDHHHPRPEAQSFHHHLRNESPSVRLDLLLPTTALALRVLAPPKFVLAKRLRTNGRSGGSARVMVASLTPRNAGVSVPAYLVQSPGVVRQFFRSPVWAALLWHRAQAPSEQRARRGSAPNRSSGSAAVANEQTTIARDKQEYSDKPLDGRWRNSPVGMVHSVHLMLLLAAEAPAARFDVGTSSTRFPVENALENFSVPTLKRCSPGRVPRPVRT